MKTAILLLAVVGVAPAVIVSAFLLCTSLFVPLNADFRPPHARHVSLSQRVHSVSFIFGQKLMVDTVLWLPLLVVLLGAAFLGVTIFMLRSHG
jgi:hypothetical protein